MTANAYIARERLDYFADMLVATGWAQKEGGWLAPHHMQEALALEVGKGSLHLWTAVAAQIQLDQAVISLSQGARK